MRRVLYEKQFRPVKNKTFPSTIEQLEVCAKQKNLGKGSKLHVNNRKHHFLGNNCDIASPLVSMYARCGALAKAQQMLCELPVRSAITWSTLIAGYIQHGQSEEALKCFDSMLHEGHSPNLYMLICALKACGSIGSVAKGQKIHDMIVSLGMLGKDTVLGNTLVGMYARCGALAKAQQVLSSLPDRDVITWTSLIAGYAKQGQSEEALKSLNSMLSEGHFPDAVTLTCALKACGNLGAVATGEKIHGKVVSLDIVQKDMKLGTSLVDMYAKCGAFDKALQVLNELPNQDTVTWNALIAGYAQQGHGEEALKCFDRMQHEGHCPNEITFLFALRACGSIGAAVKGEKLHEQIVSLGLLEKYILLGNSLVDMYARCGAIGKAQQAFNMLHVRDVVTWTVLIAGYAQQGQGEEALKCFDSMEHEGQSPNEVTFTCALKACGSIGATIKGEKIHNMIVSLGMLQKDLVLASTLIDMYTRCDALAKAQQVLDELPVRNVVTWTTLIAGYTQQGKSEEAMRCFNSMQSEGHTPNVVSLICALKACGSIGTAFEGKKIHEKIVNFGILEQDVVLGTAVVDMYARCGALTKARHVFYELPVRNAITWTALITGYVQHGQNEEALKCFDNMQCEGHSPDVVTFICALKACGSIGAVVKGEKIHEKMVDMGMLAKSIVLGNALVDMYVKCAALDKAQQILKKLSVRNVITWTTLIAGYSHYGQCEQALKCFDIMQSEGYIPNVVTLICALKACGSVGAVTKGELIHDTMVSLYMLEEDIILGNTLVDMYAKCASLVKAVEVLEELPLKDVVAWNSLIAGYAQQGQSGEAFKCLQRMQSKGIKPDSTTLVSMLNSFSHSGLLDQGEVCFQKMNTELGITPDEEHYTSMVDLFGRAGNINRALLVIEKMPSFDYLSVWLSLLGACSKWKEVEIGRLAFSHALLLDKSDAGAYICMINIYTSAGMQEDAHNFEANRLYG